MRVSTFVSDGHLGAQAHAGTALAYRRDIDGLRFIAILLVVVYHAFPAWIPAGFVGVDVFFVISGYLITSIIVREAQAQGFSYRRFYSRRIRRLFPVLLIVLAVSLALGWRMSAPQEYKQLAAHVIAGLLFSANLNLFFEAGYFAVGSESLPLLHLWSLGVEEQFYVVWPVVLLLMLPRLLLSRRLVISIALGLFALCAATSAISPVGGFYLPFARFWELFVGAALVFLRHGNQAMTLPRQHSPGVAGRVRVELTAISGLVLIILPALMMRSGGAFPFPMAALPVLGCAMLITTERSLINLHVLSSRWCVSVGLVSYGLYLWHWPFLAFLRIDANGEPSVGARAAALVLALGLSALSYLFVERWFRRPGAQRLKLSLLGIASAVLLVAAANIHARNGLEFRVGDMLRDAIGHKHERQQAWRMGTCFIEKENGGRYSSDCIGSKDRPDVLLWGDSHAASLYPGLAPVLNRQGLSLAQYTGALCKPLLGDGRMTPGCQRNNEFVREVVAKHNPRIVILRARWTREDADSIRRTVDSLRQAGAPTIVLVGPSPTWQDHLPRLVFQHQRQHRHEPLAWSSRCDRTEVEDMDRFFADIARNSGIGYVTFDGMLYGAEGCRVQAGDGSRQIMAFDADHLTLAGSSFVGPQVWEQVRSHMRSVPGSSDE